MDEGRERIKGEKSRSRKHIRRDVEVQERCTTKKINNGEVHG